MDPTPERLQKILARTGLGSRRTIESWIKAGRVSVNGRIAQLGDSARAGDRIAVDGVPLDRSLVTPTRVLAYYKPAGLVCTRQDPEGRPTVYEKLPKLSRGRWIGIGRLDLMSAGLLLFTNDGALAYRLMHPSSRIEREYAVRVLGWVGEDALKRLLGGVELEDGWARFGSIVDASGQGTNRWFRVTLCEGRNREVRRLWESQGITVSRLIRIRYGSVVLPRDKHPGEGWELTETEIQALEPGDKDIL
jgi:23S rRNA pseudouridine2605 synthase